MQRLLKILARLAIGLLVLGLGLGAVFGLAYAGVQIAAAYSTVATAANILVILLAVGLLVYAAYEIGKSFVD